jgi:hypothetical protein
MKKTLIAIALVVSIAGCRAQVPPATGYKTNLNWQAPVVDPIKNPLWLGCTTSNPCTYGVYRCIGSTATCSNTASTGWSELTTPAARVSGLTFIDSTVPSGVQANYSVVVFQGTADSGPSNIMAFNIPGVPPPPVLGNPSLATALTYRLPDRSLYAQMSPVRLGGKVR